MARSPRGLWQAGLAAAGIAGVATPAEAADSASVAIQGVVPTICMADFRADAAEPSMANARLGVIWAFCNAIGGYTLEIVDAFPGQTDYAIANARDVTRVAPNAFRVKPMRQLNAELIGRNPLVSGRELQSAVRVRILPFS